MKVGTRLTEDKLWNVRKTCVSGQQLRCLPAQRGWKALLEINNINLQLPVNYIINRRNRRASDYLQVDQRDRQTQWVTAALQVCISCSFFKLYIYIGVSKRKVNIQAVERDIVGIFKGFVNPLILLFVIAFDFERLRIDQDIFFDGGMRAIILEFPRSVGEFCGGGKDFHNDAWGLDRLNSSPVTWIARHRRQLLPRRRFQRIRWIFDLMVS